MPPKEPTIDSPVQDVPRSTKEKVLGTLGGVLTAGSGRGTPQQSPLFQKMQEDHQKRLNEARMHQKNYAAAKGALTSKIDPEFHLPFDDPHFKEKTGYEGAERAEYWKQVMDTSEASYYKIAGTSKEAKELAKQNIQRAGFVANAISQKMPPPPQASALPGSNEGPSTPPPPPQAGPPAPPKMSSLEAMTAGQDAQRGEQERRELDLFRREQEILSERDVARVRAKPGTAGTGQQRIYKLSDMSQQSAQEWLDSGQELLMYGSDQPIDLKQLPPGTMLQEIAYTDMETGEDGQQHPVRKIRFYPHDPKRTMVRAGNRIGFVNLTDPKEVSGWNNKQINPGKTTLRDQITIGPDGKPMVNTLGTDTIPKTSEPVENDALSPRDMYQDFPAFDKQPTSAPPLPAPGGQTSKPPAAPKSSPDGKTTPAAPSGGSSVARDRRGHPLGMPSGMFNPQSKVATAVTQTRNSLIGDKPGEVGGLLADLDVFKNPSSVKRISEYLSLVDKVMSNDEAAAKASGPIAYAEWMFNLPQAVIGRQQGALRDASSKLTDAEQKFVADYYRVIGTLSGMRSSTGMPATAWSYHVMRAEVPTPGPTVSYKNAVDRMMNYVHETNVSAKRNGLLDQVDEKSLRDQLLKVPPRPAPVPKEAEWDGTHWVMPKGK